MHEAEVGRYRIYLWIEWVVDADDERSSLNIPKSYQTCHGDTK